jgi:hypothetical protein
MYLKKYFGGMYLDRRGDVGIIKNDQGDELL